MMRYSLAIFFFGVLGTSLAGDSMPSTEPSPTTTGTPNDPAAMPDSQDSPRVFEQLANASASLLPNISSSIPSGVSGFFEDLASAAGTFATGVAQAVGTATGVVQNVSSGVNATTSESKTFTLPTFPSLGIPSVLKPEIGGSTIGVTTNSPSTVPSTDVPTMPPTNVPTMPPTDVPTMPNQEPSSTSPSSEVSSNPDISSSSTTQVMQESDVSTSTVPTIGPTTTVQVQTSEDLQPTVTQSTNTTNEQV